MSEILFQFGEYTVRMAAEEDRELLTAWIAGDPEHSAKRTPAGFFFAPEPGVGCYLLSDASGPLYFFRTENIVRLHSQFGPSGTEEERGRNRKGLVEGMDWLADQCARRGALEILFESANPLLSRLAVQQMGCRRSSHELVRDLTMERLRLKINEPWPQVPQPMSDLEAIFGFRDTTHEEDI